MNTLLGIKKDMGQTYVEGTRIPFTRIEVEPCVVTQIKDIEKDGYYSVQLGTGEKKLSKTSKALQGHLKKAQKSEKISKTTLKFLREVKLDKKSDLNVGDVVNLSDVFKKGDEVTVTGISKGKGFAGVVKRWHFAGGPKTHGQSDRFRAPGSIGQGTTPGRVYKGKKMAGRMGSDQKTIPNLIIVEVDSDTNEILVSGPVPGNRNGLLVVTKTGSGKLSELISEAPQIQVQEEVEEDKEATKEGSKEEPQKEKQDEQN